MNHSGVILAENLSTAQAFRDDLGLPDWLATTPTHLTSGAHHRDHTGPRILVISGTSPWEAAEQLKALTGTETPALYWITGSAL